jgi:hypothetical protein
MSRGPPRLESGHPRRGWSTSSRSGSWGRVIVGRLTLPGAIPGRLLRRTAGRGAARRGCRSAHRDRPGGQAQVQRVSLLRIVDLYQLPRWTTSDREGRECSLSTMGATVSGCCLSTASSAHCTLGRSCTARGGGLIARPLPWPRRRAAVIGVRDWNHAPRWRATTPARRLRRHSRLAARCASLVSEVRVSVTHVRGGRNGRRSVVHRLG